MISRVLNYKIESKIGEGGMGSVYLASHALINRKAAIKALNPALASNPLIREKFKNEAFALAQLKHPAIVDLYDYYEDQTGLYLIMEYVEGLTLDEYIQKISGPIPEERCIRLMIRILEGFQYAHKKGIVHRDIKPTNLMITPDLSIKILDFGIARLLYLGKEKTNPGLNMGTVLYMSPEQVKGEDIDSRSDIYSLGVLFFEMLSAKNPYEEIQNPNEVYQKILYEPLPEIPQHKLSKLTEIKSIILRATAKDPQNRFQNCQEFINALQHLQDDFEKKAEPVKIQKPARKKKKSRAGLNFIIFLLILVLSGGLGVVLFNPFHYKELEKYALLENYVYGNKKKEKEEAQLDSLRKTAIEKTAAFYKVLETRKLEFIKPFFKDTILNYYGTKNIRFSPDVRASLKVDWQKYSSEKFEIIEDTFFVKEDSLKNKEVFFEYSYTFKTKTTNLVTLVKNAEIKFDKQWKIFHIDHVKTK